MNYPPELTSLNLERQCLGGLINKPEVLVDIESVVSDREFSNSIHQRIFSVLKNMVLNGEKIEKIILAQKVKDLKIQFEDGLDPFSYIEDISYTQIQIKGIKEIIKELINLRVRRDLYQKTEEEKEYIKNSGGKDLTEVINHIDSIHHKQIMSYSTEDNPEDLVDNIENVIKQRINQKEVINIQSPFPIFNEMFGNLRVGITAICGRAKHNKSTILLNIGWGAILKQENLKCLYLDTELKKDDHQFRIIGAFAQVNPYLLETGEWSHNPELAKKVESSWEIARKLKGKLFHYYVGNKPIEEIGSIIRRWYFSKAGRNNPAIIIFDYIKIGNERLSNFNLEYQQLGQKINYLNEISQQLQIPILTSMQLNRSAITDQKEDESTISMTDRLSWFANNVCIFRKKRPDEINDETQDYGTHKLIPVVSRYQGKNTGLLDLVRIVDSHGKSTYKPNFINYEFSNFRLTEKGTLRDIVIQRQLSANLQTPNNDDSNDI
jgi:replicative DNA helicase